MEYESITSKLLIQKSNLHVQIEKYNNYSETSVNWNPVS